MKCQILNQNFETSFFKKRSLRKVTSENESLRNLPPWKKGHQMTHFRSGRFCELTLFFEKKSFEILLKQIAN